MLVICCVTTLTLRLHFAAVQSIGQVALGELRALLIVTPLEGYCGIRESAEEIPQDVAWKGR